MKEKRVRLKLEGLAAVSCEFLHCREFAARTHLHFYESIYWYILVGPDACGYCVQGNLGFGAVGEGTCGDGDCLVADDSAGVNLGCSRVSDGG